MDLEMDLIMLKRSLTDFIKKWEENAQGYRQDGKTERAAGVENLLQNLRDEVGYLIRNDES